MSTENVPAVSAGLLPTQQEFNMYQFIAQTAMKSGLYGGVGGDSQIFMVLLAARELGIAPMLALNGGIWNIKGRIEISARLMNAMIRRKGHILTIKGDSKSCTIIGKRCDTAEEAEETFTIEMAKTAKLVKTDGVWEKYAEDMLYNRCMSRLARRLFSDVIGTAYVQGETREVTPEEIEPSFYEEINKPLKQPIAQPKKDDKPPRLDDDQVANVGKPIFLDYISEDQAKQIGNLCREIGPERYKSFMKYILENFNAKRESHIPATEFQRMVNFLNQIIALNKLPEIV